MSQNRCKNDEGAGVKSTQRGPTVKPESAEQQQDELIKKISDQRWRPVRGQSRCSLQPALCRVAAADGLDPAFVRPHL